MYGRVKDSKNHIFHDLEILNEIDNLKFKYLFSRKYSRKVYRNNFFFEMTETNIDSTKKNYDSCF